MAILFDGRVINPRQFQPGVYTFDPQNIPVGTTRMEARISRSDANNADLEGIVLIEYRTDVSRDNGLTWYRFNTLYLNGGLRYDRGDPAPLREWDYHRATGRGLLHPDTPADANTQIRGEMTVYQRMSTECWVTLFDQ